MGFTYLGLFHFAVLPMWLCYQQCCNSNFAVGMLVDVHQL